MNKHKVWFHGAQAPLTSIIAGSSITPYKQVAIAFSHRPSIVSLEDDGSIRHNGEALGYLHRVVEPLTENAVTLHPACQEGADWEWLVKRAVRVELLAEYDVDPQMYLSPEAVQKLQDAK